MTRTVNLTTQIPDSREVLIQLPRDVPTGAARIVLEIMPGDETLEDLRNRPSCPPSGFHGIMSTLRFLGPTLVYLVTYEGQLQNHDAELAPPTPRCWPS